MTTMHRQIEYRFWVPGKPESFRVPAAAAFKERVALAAARVFPSPLVDRDLEIRIDHFHQVDRPADMDNVAKSVLDALNGVAYVDDRQVKKQSSNRHDLRGVVKLDGCPVDLTKPLVECREYIFVRLRVQSIGSGT